MINVVDYIKLVLKKKKLTQMELCRRVNKIEEKLHEKKTNRQYITNGFNDYYSFGPRTLAKFEAALELPERTLIRMVTQPVSREVKKSLDDYIKIVRNI